MLGALLIMIPVRWVYLAVGDLETAEEQPAGRKVSASLLLLPLVVTAIIVIVKFSLALAFALTGIFAGVRYRTSLKNLTDALFIFACMAVGLAAGTQALGIALALSIFFVFTAVSLEPLVSEKSPNQADEEPERPNPPG
jgi:phosphoglycerol transferase MdoB-like AlkP superfamily enzyme